MEIEKRKGARSIKDIPKEISKQLNNGEIESANLVEWLAIDQKVLLENILKAEKRMAYFKPILSKIEALKNKTITTINEAIGTGLLEEIILHKDDVFLEILAHHKSDSVRCWATYIIGKNNKSKIQKILKDIKPFAADSHFGVREICWIAVRPKVVEDLDESIKLLESFTKDKDANIRRFASELTRPRGVWCKHIDLLKTNPEKAISILEPLKNDASKYVQDSVGNWLNDASKTAPKFVIALCKKWQLESNTPATNYIIKKAMRTLEK
jgi:3-methyladenine DNA glycosylase AlkC